MNWTHWFAGMMDTRPSDRMYNCLPMYHSVGGAVATGAVLVNGGSVVIRDRFSAARVLGRHQAPRLHDVPVHRRAVPLPPARHPSLARETPHRTAALLRQRPAGGRLGALPEALRHSADPGILRRHRGQHLAVQRRGAAGRDRPDRRPSSRIAPRLRSGQVRRRTRPAAARRPRTLHCGARRTRSARRSAASPGRRTIAARASTATPRPPRRKRKSCATCSSPATPGFAPAT